LDGWDQSLPFEVQQEVEIQVKYEGYIRRQLEQVEAQTKLESKPLPQDLDYSKIYGLSREAREKLGALKPQSLGQAGRISGVTPADLSVLTVALQVFHVER
jgi:tRNA uridine 5-carboxymethylaminomethyl modification enzyme